MKDRGSITKGIFYCLKSMSYGFSLFFLEMLRKIPEKWDLYK